MLKELTITIFIIASIILLNAYLQNYTKNSVSEVSSQLEELKKDLKKNDKDKVIENLKKAKDNWSKQYGILAMYIEHDELEKVEADLVSLEGYIEIDEYNMGINEIDKSIFSLKHINEKYDFSLVNVF